MTNSIVSKRTYAHDSQLAYLLEKFRNPHVYLIVPHPGIVSACTEYAFAIFASTEAAQNLDRQRQRATWSPISPLTSSSSPRYRSTVSLLDTTVRSGNGNMTLKVNSWRLLIDPDLILEVVDHGTQNRNISMWPRSRGARKV